MGRIETASIRWRARIAGPTLLTVLTSFAGQAFLAVSGIAVARMLGVEDRGNFALLILIPSILTQVSIPVLAWDEADAPLEITCIAEPQPPRERGGNRGSRSFPGTVEIDEIMVEVRRLDEVVAARVPQSPHGLG